MTIAKPASISLEEFLTLPETRPPSEYVNGVVIQKPMPKSRHSRLQSKLSETLNGFAESRKIAYAFPELRCTFGGRSVVSDIAVLRWQNIVFDEDGEPVDDVFIPPDWTIEILSPNQSANRVADNILHCLKFGCTLGWLVDLEDRSILVLQPKQPPKVYYAQALLPMLDGFELALTVEHLFDWLKMQV